MTADAGNGGGDPSPQKDGNSWADLAKVIAVPASFAALLSSLAVTGVLGQMERNHGEGFAIACSLVFFAAGLWVAVALFPPPKHPGGDNWRGKLKRYWRTSLQVLGVVSLSVGLIFAIVTLIRTQNDPNEPSIVASITGSALTATVSASGLSTRDHIEVHVDGLIGATSAEPRRSNATSLFWASVGADNDGKVSLPITLQIPATKFTAIAIRAFSGDHSECLQNTKGKLRRLQGPGCVIMLLSGT
jgi:amino acid permease